MSTALRDPEAVTKATEASEIPFEEVVAETAELPSAADLKRATTVRLSDLMRVGSETTTQRIGAWGAGKEVCALSTAAVGMEALKAL